MGHSSHFPKADRRREEAIAESTYWDETFQPHLQVSPTSVAGAHAEQASIPDNGQDLYRPIGSSHDVLVETPSLLMTDAFPTGASAITNATSSAAPSTTSPPLYEESDELFGNSDSDIDLGIDSPVHDPSRSSLSESLYNTISPDILGPDASPSRDAEDYDLDMSDDDYGGVPLLDDMDHDLENVASVLELDLQDAAAFADPSNSNEEEPDSEEEGPNNIDALPPPMPIGFQYFQMPPMMNNQIDMNALMGTPVGLDQIPDQFLNDAPLISNPNPMMVGSQNLHLFDFLRHWALRSRMSRFHGQGLGMGPPAISAIRQQAALEIKEIKYSDLHGDSCDMQGLDWVSMNTTRRFAREWRGRTFQNYTNRCGSDVKPPGAPDTVIPTTDSFFRFRSLLVRKDVHIAHFQLRSVLACPSRTQAFYPSRRGIHRINVDSKETEMNLNLTSIYGLGSVVSTLDANHGVLMAGMFNGEYCLKNLDSLDGSHFTSGYIINKPRAITNHLQVYLPRRSSDPNAAISNNDNGFRIMDLKTEKLISERILDYSPNCSAVSTDGRLRIIVGDKPEVMIEDADNGHLLRELSGHRDFGFSCDWSDDGWTLATGNQDKTVKIWDARKWCDSKGVGLPIKTIQSKLAGVRKLRFSPLGSGPRVLVATEESDFINIIDAQTFESQQTIDVFGEICGAEFTNDGQDLNILCGDNVRGGLLQLERLGTGPEPFRDGVDWRRDSDGRKYAGEPYRRKPAMLDELLIF